MHKFCFDKSCCYLSGGADIVIFNSNGILVMDVKDNSLDDSTEEGELKGVCALESKLLFNAADINQVIGEGVMFASRYLFKMITDGNICSEDIVAVEAYLIWMTLLSTIRFYVLRLTIYCHRYS